MKPPTPKPIRQVVTVFLEHQGKILLVRRSQRVGSYQGRWSGISGYLEDPTPLAQALREIQEETGLKGEDITLLKSGPPLSVDDPDSPVLWEVHPFLFQVEHPEAIRLDWENTELCWVTPTALSDYPTVPALAEALAQVYPP
ncbi:NUDIX hydrolase [Nitrosococcus halophilus Nc 4]|uniref:NUDIX hydrolase n=1 Tax=Nitrosococcus halophilus (strain Nc4) TaxID=472759 RepID=D5C580_NITHN|nr:NUDIX pyrophosphatase [Nitrosococcus halophilus]ADE15303.1 NUDIX hydrolase [Nitrosococcus halophilus Nc 4]